MVQTLATRIRFRARHIHCLVLDSTFWTQSKADACSPSGSGVSAFDNIGLTLIGVGLLLIIVGAIWLSARVAVGTTRRGPRPTDPDPLRPQPPTDASHFPFSPGPAFSSLASSSAT